MGSFILIVHIEIKADAVDRFMPLALENARSSRESEPGCRQFDVLVDPRDSTKVVFYEVYDDQAAFETHQKTPHFRKYLDTALEHVASRRRVFYSRRAPA